MSYSESTRDLRFLIVVCTVLVESVLVMRTKADSSTRMKANYELGL